MNLEGLSTQINFNIERYDIPYVILFASKCKVFPSCHRVTDYFDLPKVLTHITKVFKVDAENMTGEYQMDYENKVRLKEGLCELKDGLFLYMVILSDIKTSNPGLKMLHIEDYDDDEEFTSSDHFKVKIEFLFDPEKHKSNDIGEYIAEIKKFIVQKKTKGSINIVVSSGSEFDLKPFKLQPVDVDIALNYGDKFKELHDYMFERLNNETNSKGIALFYGDPGTGKTMYIRHLINTVMNKKVIYVTPDMAREITQPSFVTFMMEHPNSILVIEDAETILRSRKSGSNQSVANLLNLADGLLSDCLSMQIVCTFNCDIGEIDTALMRKGRLIGMHKFEKLSIEQAQKVALALKKDINVSESMTLAEIYNYGDRDFTENKSGKIGFGKR